MSNIGSNVSIKISKGLEMEQIFDLVFSKYFHFVGEFILFSMNI